jgi:hypothetical protein
MSKDKVMLELNKYDALVFFELLCRINNGTISIQFDDDSERQVLTNIECLLERELSEPFASNYIELLKNARAMVKGKIDSE